MSKRKVGAKPIDRILWNRGRETVDEIVVHDCIVHMEQMTDEAYWIGVYKGDQALAVNLWIKEGELRCRVQDEGTEPWFWDQDGEHK